MVIVTLEYKHRKCEPFKKNVITKSAMRFNKIIVSGHSLVQVFGLPDFDLIGTFD